jgi:hypothetical protein
VIEGPASTPLDGAGDEALAGEGKPVVLAGQPSHSCHGLVFPTEMHTLERDV